MNAIISAGGTVKENDLLTGILNVGNRKALLPLAGKPMIQWELDAISTVASIENVIIIGLAESDNLQCPGKPIHYIPDAGGLIDNIKAGASKSLALTPNIDKVIWFSSDVPLIKPGMIQWLIDKSSTIERDVYYLIIEKTVMESRFPESKRTYTRLRDQVVCGGDFGIFKASVASDTHPALPRISQARKSIIRQAMLVGILPLLILLCRRMTVERARTFLQKKLSLDLQFVECPYAEAGMDVDKPFQYELVKQTLESIE